MKLIHRASFIGFAALCWAVWMSGAQAQYKYVSPSGEVTYSDQPPPPGARDIHVKNFRTGADAANANLPFDVRQAMTKFPVTIYTTSNCSSCDSGKNFLRQRGIPYSEKLVVTNDDLAALKRVTPDGTIPTFQVGSQHIGGYNDAAWGSLLDDAGYPRINSLPKTYQNAAPETASGQPAGGASQ